MLGRYRSHLIERGLSAASINLSLAAIVSGLSRYLDSFLAAYLRGNESACGSAPATP